MVWEIERLEESHLKELSPSAYAKHIMVFPAKKRMELILERTDAREIVESMNVQDFYMTVMEIGPDDALPLLSLADIPKWIHLFDMESWEKDRLQPYQAMEWLDRLARSSEEALIRWLYSVDFFFFISLLKKSLRVAVKPDDIDLVEAYDFLPPNTIDDQYFWESLYPQYNDLVKRILSILFETNYAYYKEVMEHAIYAIDAEMEEEAYRFKKGRLEDEAVPDYYDAIAIYAPIEIREVSFYKKSVIKDELPLEPPLFALVKLSSEDLFGASLNKITDPSIRDYISLELASLCNKVLIADRIKPGNEDDVKEALEMVFSTLNLGLHLLGGGDPVNSLYILKSAFIEHIFRVGYTAISRIRHRAKRIVEEGWIAGCPIGMAILDEKLYESMELLMNKHPKLLDESGRNPRFFRTTLDIQRASDILDTVLCLGILVDKLNVRWEEMKLLWMDGSFSMVEDITVTPLIFTSIARSILEGKIFPFTAFLELSSWAETWQRFHPDEVERVLTKWLEINLPQKVRKTLASYIDDIIRDYREEMLPFYNRSEMPDPRFVRFFIFKTQ